MKTGFLCQSNSAETMRTVTQQLGRLWKQPRQHRDVRRVWVQEEALRM